MGRKAATGKYATYLELPHCRLAEVFGASICPKGDEIAAVNVLFLEAALTLLGASDSLPLELSGLALRSCFLVLKRRIWAISSITASR